MLVTCFVTVMLSTLDGGRQPTLIEMEGRVTSATNSTYTVDFAGEARLLGLEGNYSHKVVPKADCGKFD